MRNIIKNISAALKRDAAYRQAIRELAALDNRSLDDLGISRADIRTIARQHSRSVM